MPKYLRKEINPGSNSVYVMVFIFVSISTNRGPD
jgi:hypothetical protein